MTDPLADRVREFRVASVRDGSRRAADLLAAAPEIEHYDLSTAILLGDADRVRAEIERDPAAATRPDPETGWTPLHAVAASRWHRLDPARADGLVAVARLLLDAGADPGLWLARGWTPLRCAVAGAANPAITALLLDRGARPVDHDVYLACFGGDELASLRLLLPHATDLAHSTALSAPISTGDTEAVRLLLDAGVDPRLPVDDEPTVHSAVRAGCPAALVALLLEHGASPDEPGSDGRSPVRVAVTTDRADLADLLLRSGARDDVTDVDRFLAACLSADESARDHNLVDRLTDADRGTLVRAAGAGRTEAVAVMLDLGFPVEAAGDDGARALHAAAYAGSAATVRLLLARGADVAAEDGQWHSAPLVWAVIGSAEHAEDDSDWADVVRALIDAGAPELTVDPGDPRQPGPQVADLLRQRRNTPAGS